jgi:acyl-CoA thioesterase
MSDGWPRLALSGEPPFDVRIGSDVCSSLGWLFGGWGMGLLAEAAQTSTGRAVRDLSVDFVRGVADGARLRVHCEPMARGRTFTYCRVSAVDERDDVALSGTAVLAQRGAGGAPPATALLAPKAPPPEVCPERQYALGPGTGTSLLLDVRDAGEDLSRGAGNFALLWARLRCPAADEVRLAVISDHVPFLLRRSMPAPSRFTTVGATLRLWDAPLDEWVLLEVSLVSLGERSAVGRVNLWSAGTELVGVAEQTTWMS